MLSEVQQAALTVIRNTAKWLTLDDRELDVEDICEAPPYTVQVAGKVKAEYKETEGNKIDGRWEQMPGLALESWEFTGKMSVYLDEDCEELAYTKSIAVIVEYETDYIREFIEESNN